MGWDSTFRLAGLPARLAGDYRLEMEFDAEPGHILPRLTIRHRDGRHTQITLPPAAPPRLSARLRLPADCVGLALAPAPWPIMLRVRAVGLCRLPLSTRMDAAVRRRLARLAERGGGGVAAGMRRWLLTRLADTRARVTVEGVAGVLRNPRTRWRRPEGAVELDGRDWFYSQLPDDETRARLVQQAEQDGAARDSVILIAPGTEAQGHAAARLALARRQSGADLVYGDEMATAEDGSWTLRARSAFSHDAFLSDPDLGGMVAVSPALARRAGLGASHALTAGTLLRLVGHAATIAHVADVLCLRPRTAIAANRATVAEVQSYVDHLRRPTQVDGQTAHGFDIRMPTTQPWKAGIVVPTRNGLAVLTKCVAAIERTCDPSQYHLLVVDHQSDDPAVLAYLDDLRRRHSVTPFRGPFNFSAINNHAVRHLPAECNLVVLMNNDVEALTPDWLPRLAETALRDDVGVVAPLLLYPDHRVQHAGLVIGLYGLCEHVAKWQPAFLAEGERNPGPLGLLCGIRDSSALTGACMVLKRDSYDALGGLDESLAVGCNDVDLCLRLRLRGLKALFDGRVVMIHHESVSRGTSRLPPHPVDTARFRHRYRELLAAGDPFFSPLLSLDHLTPTPRQPYQPGRPTGPYLTPLPPWEDR